MPRRRAIVLLTLVLLLTAALARIAAETVLYSRNVFALHRDWVLGKRLLAGHSMGADMASLTRQILRRDRLNLGEWHGFQEVLFARVFRPGSVRWRFAIADGGVLHAIIDRDRRGFAGFRLSRDPLRPGLWYHADASGAFLDRRELPALELDGSIHEGEWRFEGGGALALSVDGREVARVAAAPLDRQEVGFRGGAQPAWVDDVQIFDDAGRRLVREGFDAPEARGPATAVQAGLWLAVLGAATAWARRRGIAWATVANWALMFQGTALILVGCYFAFDWYYWSGAYPYGENSLWVVGAAPPRRLERIREGLFDSLPLTGSPTPSWPAPPDPETGRFLGLPPDAVEAGRNLQLAWGAAGAAHYETAADEPASTEWRLRPEVRGAVRILLLGGSQTWGLGATLPADRMANRLQAGLADRFAGRASVCVLNAGQRGARSGDLLDRYRASLHRLDPNVVVVNLASNDAPTGFAERLDEIAGAAQGDGAEVVFVLEANCPGLEVPGLRRKHAAMRSVAERRRLRVLDLHGYVSRADVRDSGLLWWDFVHLTSYGQARAATFLADGLEEPVAAAIGRIRSE